MFAQIEGCCPIHALPSLIHTSNVLTAFILNVRAEGVLASKLNHADDIICRGFQVHLVIPSLPTHESGCYLMFDLQQS